MTLVLLRRKSLGKTSCNAIAENIGEGASVVRNWIDPFPEDATMIFRWGCTSNTPEGVPVVQSARAIHIVSDKTGFRRLLMEQAPETIPETWFHPNELQHPLRGPVIVRKSPHHQGRNLHLCNDEASVRAACGRYDNFYISEYVDKVEEYRVCFVQGLVAWVAKKTPANPEDIAWNVARGGRFDNVRWGEWPIEAVKTAKRAFDLSGLHYGGVDVMIDREGRAYVLEINSAPSLTSPYRQQCMAKCFKYIYERGVAPPLVPNVGNEYRTFIHPAVKEA